MIEKKRPFKIIKEFPSLGTPKVKLRVRVVETNQRFLDIRLWIREKNKDGSYFEGYTLKGIMLSWQDIHLLEEMLPEIKKEMGVTEEKPAEQGGK